MIVSLFFPFEHFGAAHLATVLIGLVCAYLGTFLVMRRTVFVGITIGELAALGIAVAFRSFTLVSDETPVGHLWHEHGAVLGALLFGILGVALFGHGSRGSVRMSPDARLGVGYAAAAGFALVLVSGTAQGLEELKNVLAGSVLFVSDARLGLIAIVMLVISAVHVSFRKEFLFASYDPDMARTLGVPARFYDAILDLTIGVAIAVAIQSAGLLLVFGFLVLPALAGFHLSGRLGGASAVAVGVALIGSTAGLSMSAAQDWPIGPAVIVGLFVVLMGAVIVSRTEVIARWGRRGVGVAVVLCLPPLAVAFSSVVFETHFFEPERIHAGHEVVVGTGGDAVARSREAPGRMPSLSDYRRILRTSSDPVERAETLALLGRLGNDDAYPDLVAALGDPDESVREAAVDALGELGDPRAVDQLRAVAASTDDETLLLHAALALVHLGEREGAGLLVDLLQESLFPFTRDEALTALVAIAGDANARGFDPDEDADGNRDAIARWRAWWSEAGPDLDGDALARPFEDREE